MDNQAFLNPIKQIKSILCYAQSIINGGDEYKMQKPDDPLISDFVEH